MKINMLTCIFLILLLILAGRINFGQAFNIDYLGQLKKNFRPLEFKIIGGSTDNWYFTSWNDSLLRPSSVEYHDELNITFTRMRNITDTTCHAISFTSFISDSIAYDSLGIVYYKPADSTIENQTLDMLENIIKIHVPEFIVSNRVRPETYRRYPFTITKNNTVFAKGEILWNRQFYQKYGSIVFNSRISLSIVYAGTTINTNTISKFPIKGKPIIIIEQ